MARPEWVSWYDIHNLLLAAHKRNLDKGIVMNTTTLSGEDISKYLGNESRCFIALCGDTLIGTTSVRISVGTRWFDKGKTVAKGTLTAILPQYQGLGILEEMNELRDAYVLEKGVEMLEGDTPESNTVVRKFVARNGFKEVHFFPAHHNHFSVLFVKWLNGCPFSDQYIKRRFNLSKRLTLIQYKKDVTERSRILSFFCRYARKLLLKW